MKKKTKGKKRQKSAKKKSTKKKSTKKKSTKKKSTKKKSTKKKSATKANGKTVPAYIASLSGWQAQAVARVRKIIREAAPQSTEALKWSQPVFEDHGPFAYIRSFKTHVNVGFWRGSSLPDPKGILTGAGKKMAHIKLLSLADIDKKSLARLVRAAVKLNRTDGDPTR